MVGMSIWPPCVPEYLRGDISRLVGVAQMPQLQRPEAAHRDTGVRGNLKDEHSMLFRLVQLGSSLRFRECRAVVSDRDQRLTEDLVAGHDQTGLCARLGER